MERDPVVRIRKHTGELDMLPWSAPPACDADMIYVTVNDVSLRPLVKAAELEARSTEEVERLRKAIYFWKKAQDIQDEEREKTRKYLKSLTTYDDVRTLKSNMRAEPLPRMLPVPMPATDGDDFLFVDHGQENQFLDELERRGQNPTLTNFRKASVIYTDAEKTPQLLTINELESVADVFEWKVHNIREHVDRRVQRRQERDRAQRERASKRPRREKAQREQTQDELMIVQYHPHTELSNTAHSGSSPSPPPRKRRRLVRGCDD